MRKIKVIAFYRGKLFETRGTPIRVLNLLLRLDKREDIDLTVFSWDERANTFKNHNHLTNNHRDDILKIRNSANQNNADVIIGYTASALYYTVFLKFLTRAKITFESHGFIEDEALEYGDIGLFKFYLYKVFFGIAYWLCDFVMTSDGPSVGNVLSKYNKNVCLLTGGVDENIFKPEVESGKYIKKDGRITIGYAGNARVWQGVDFLIDSYRELIKTNKNFRLVLLLSEKKEYGNGIEVYGPLPNHEVPKFLIDCDILVIPRPRTLVTSIAYPSKLTEYLGLGKAVIGSNVGDMDKIIKNKENGLIYTAGKKEELINCFKLLQDASIRSRLGIQAVKKAKTMTWDMLVNQLVDYLYKKV